MEQSFFTVRPANQADLARLVELRAYLLDGTNASYSSKTPEDAARWRAAYRTWLSSRLSESDCVQVLSPPSTRSPARYWVARPPSSTSAHRCRAASTACPAGCSRWWWSHSGGAAASPGS